MRSKAARPWCAWPHESPRRWLFRRSGGFFSSWQRSPLGTDACSLVQRYLEGTVTSPAGSPLLERVGGGRPLEGHRDFSPPWVLQSLTQLRARPSWALGAFSLQPLPAGSALGCQAGLWGEGQVTQAGPWKVDTDAGGLPFAGHLPAEALLPSVWLGWQKARHPLEGQDLKTLDGTGSSGSRSQPTRRRAGPVRCRGLCCVAGPASRRPSQAPKPA